jgi:hypothetical protein
MKLSAIYYTATKQNFTKSYPENGQTEKVRFEHVQLIIENEPIL